MKVRWYGQSAFALHAAGKAVFIDPFGEMESAKCWTWNYPMIAEATADLLMVTHEHADHNAVQVVKGVSQTVRSVAGTFATPVGRVTGIASEHDLVAGTQRGANVIFAFELDGIRVCHMGDFGQAELREEQRAAIGKIDMLLVPIGGTATIDGRAAAAVVEQLSPAWVVPMHYRTPAISMFDTADTFLLAVKGELVTVDRSSFDTGEIRPEGGRIIVLLAPPLAGADAS